MHNKVANPTWIEHGRVVPKDFIERAGQLTITIDIDWCRHFPLRLGEAGSPVPMHMAFFEHRFQTLQDT